MEYPTYHVYSLGIQVTRGIFHAIYTTREHPIAILYQFKAFLKVSYLLQLQSNKALKY